MKENDVCKKNKRCCQLLNKHFVNIGKNMAEAISPIYSMYKLPPFTYSKNSFLSLLQPHKK